MEREKALALYDKLLATNPGVQRKGDTMPYTSLNGNMFSLFTKENRLTLRLPAGERESFLARYKATLSEQYGLRPAGIRRRSRWAAGEDGRVEALFRHQLYICLVAAAQGDDEEEARRREAAPKEVAQRTRNESTPCQPRSSSIPADRACSAL